ncbi:diguanylate cyclase [Maridesulfovibrio sp.]|uniref:sensor domain-containing diguanylate cyclase n=1 Tax=Maridesulfovibrio sp. TaxID=2795000 RepID=UPI0029CA06F2|nr:diguanylate cyclase [Maridesulfovibrio sp.]
MRHFCIDFKGNEDLLRLQKKIASHPPDQILIQVFCGTSDQEKITLLRSKLTEFFPGTAIIGASSAGEIINAQVTKHSIVISISLFNHTKVKTSLVDQNDDLKAAGLTMGTALEKSSPKAVIAFGCGLKNGNFLSDLPFLKALSKKLGRIPLAGGQAGGYDEQNSTVYVFTEKGFTTEGFVAASLSGPKLCIYTAYDLGWVPIGKKMTVTHSKNSRLYSIDDKPANEIYRYYLGIESDPSSLYLANNFPLMVTRGNKGDIRTTNPIAAVNRDGSFELMQKLHTGEQVQFSFYDVSLLEESALKLKQYIKASDPGVTFVYTCISRKELFGDDINIDMDALKSCNHSAGFFTFGEYYTTQDQEPNFFQQTMTILALSESDSCNTNIRHKELDNSSRSEKDLKRFQLQKVLSHLVASTTRELKAANQVLAEQANKDGLTGLFNRRLFDTTMLAKIKEHSRAGADISLILIDIDYFKQFNDIYGHVAGDDCLRAVGHAIQEALNRPSDMAFRYGGEEFGCILSFTGQEGALTVAQNIRANVDELAIPHEGSDVNDFLTISIGVLTVNASRNIKPQEVVTACDELLYKAKNGGRNITVGMRIN